MSTGSVRQVELRDEIFNSSEPVGLIQVQEFTRSEYDNFGISDRILLANEDEGFVLVDKTTVEGDNGFFIVHRRKSKFLKVNMDDMYMLLSTFMSTKYYENELTADRVITSLINQLAE